MARYDPLPYVRPARERNLRLADLYLRHGEQQADAEERAGAIKAALWANVGRSVGETATNLITAPQQARESKAREEEIKQRTQLGKLQLGEAERQVNDRENFDLAMHAGGGSRQRTLESLKDRPELYEKAKGHFDRIDTSLKQLLGDAAAGIRDFGDTPDAAMAAMDDLLDQGFDEKKIAPFRAAIQQNPQSVKQIVDSLLSQSPDPRHQAMAKPQPLVELNKDTSLYDPNKGAVVASGPQSPPPQAPNPTEASFAAAAAAGDPDAVKALELLRAQRPTPQGREPERPSVWVNKDGASRFVTPTQAAAMSAEGWASGNSREQGRPVTSGDAGRVTDFDTSLDDLKILRATVFPDAKVDASGKVTTDSATGTTAEIQANLPNWATALLGGWGTDAKQRNAVISRVKQVIGKALEGGVLRKEDEAKYKDILPTIGDPPDVVQSKLDGLEKAIALRKQRHLDALADAGYDTSKFTAREAAKSDNRVYYDANGNPVQKKP